MGIEITEPGGGFRFRCPVCGEALCRSGGALVCPAKHSYDMAAAGYVNLLRTSSKRVHGDDGPMVHARREFLEGGSYAPLADSICEAALRCADGIENPILLDAGCGEGYYTSRVRDKLAGAGHGVTAVGVDLSKSAVSAAAKAHKSCLFAVAGIYELPVADHSCDLILSLFAPYAEKEFLRALSSRGAVIRAVPAKEHLIELKRAVYDEPRPNDPVAQPVGFTLASTSRVEYKTILRGGDIVKLFDMTPYCYRTSPSDKARLDILETLEVTVSVDIDVYIPE